MKLTLETARELAPGGVIRCHVVKGLELHAGATGKTWKVYYVSPNGAGRRRPKIGDWPAVTIERAREAAKAMLARVAKGEDPSRERQATRSAPTMRDLFEVYRTEMIDGVYATETKTAATGVWLNYILPKLGARRVCELTVADVNGLIEPIGRKQPALAHKIKSYLSAALNLAEYDSRKWRPKHSNPCQDKEAATFVQRKRRVHVEPDQFPRIGAELDKLAIEFPWHVAAVYVMLFAGSRVTELVTADESELIIDRTGARIERREHKTMRFEEVRTIRLPKQAARILAELPRHRSGFLFGPLGEMKVPRRAIWEVFNTARVAAGCPHIQPRDLRRTFATVAKSRGVALSQIGELFDHRSTQTTDGYAYIFNETARDAVDKTGDEIEKLLEGPK